MSFDKVNNRIGSYCTQWDFVQDRFGKAGLLPFTISDMDIQTPEPILNAFEKRVRQGIFGYTRWDHTDYRDAICYWYSSRFHTSIESTWIAYAPSVIYALGKFLHLMDTQKKGITLFTPCYDGFVKILHANNFPINAIPMDCDQIDWDHFERSLQKSKVFLLCNPNNPNGHLWTKDELTKIVALCKQHDVFIISDDIHMDFVYKPNNFIPITHIAKEFDFLDKVIIITSSSKTFNISGLGGAYILCPNHVLKNKYLTILKEMDSLGSAMILHIDSVIVGYNEASTWVDELCVYIYNNLQTVHDFLNQNPQLKMSAIIPNATYFSWINCIDTKLSSVEIQNKLINKGGVAIMDGDRYYEQQPFLRMIVACPHSKVVDGLEKIKQSF